MVFRLFTVDVWLQPFVEVVRAYTGIDDRCDYQDNGENSEGGQLLPRWSVGLLPSHGVHAEKFEEEIG